MYKRKRHSQPLRQIRFLNFGPKNGFTLTEILIVVILLGIIAAFAIPNYQRALDKARLRDAVIQLMGLHAANFIYNAQANEFYDPVDGVPTAVGLSTINSGLGINIVANDMAYTYSCLTYDAVITNKCVSFQAQAEFPVALPIYRMKVTEAAILTAPPGFGANPCCDLPANCPVNPC